MTDWGHLGVEKPPVMKGADGFGIPIVEPLSDEQVEAARRTVCARAHDPEDARLLLDALGLGSGS